MAPADGFDQELLLHALSEFTHTLANRFEVSDVLYELAERVVEILGVAGTGVSVVDDAGRLRPVTGVNQLTADLESTEEGLQEGPCIDAFVEGRNVIVEDLDVDAGRWPRWSTVAKKHGVHAVLGIPMQVREVSLGAMNVYSSEKRHWRDSEVNVARILCDMAASYVANASDLEDAQRTTEQLRRALDSRIVIEQAKGILANEFDCSMDEAFTVLREHSRHHGATMRSVAEGVVKLGLRPSTRHPSRTERTGREGS